MWTCMLLSVSNAFISSGNSQYSRKSHHSILGKSYVALGFSGPASFRPNNHARSCDLPRWNLLARADGLKCMLLWNFRSNQSKLCCLLFRGQLECERREECKRLSMTLPEALESIAHKLDNRNLCGIENFSDWTGGGLTPQMDMIPPRNRWDHSCAR